VLARSELIFAFSRSTVRVTEGAAFSARGAAAGGCILAPTGAGSPPAGRAGTWSPPKVEACEAPGDTAAANAAGAPLRAGGCACDADLPDARKIRRKVRLRAPQGFLQAAPARRVDHAQQPHFQMQTRIGFAAQILIGIQKNLKKAREVLFAE